MNAHSLAHLEVWLRPFRVLVLLAALLACTPLAALTIAVCDVDPEAAPAATDYYLDAARRVQLWQGDGAAPAGCNSIDLPLQGGMLRWAGLVAQDVPAPPQLGLQGSFAESGPVRVSEVDLGVASAANPQPLAPGVDVLPQFELQVFGAEERASVSLSGAVLCAAGSEPAGVVLTARASWRATRAQELELQLQGRGDIQLAVADAGRARAQAPLVLGTLPLAEDDAARIFRYRLPQQAEDWLSVTLACPSQAARFTPLALRLLPQELPLPRQRSAWFWSPALWQQQPERLLALVQAW